MGEGVNGINTSKAPGSPMNIVVRSWPTAIRSLILESGLLLKFVLS
jgi:hypothetical protein